LSGAGTTVDGRDVSVDGAKLDGIATGADVTGDNAPEAHGTSEHTEGTAWRVTYQDASGDDVELILGANGTFFQSNGASAAPTFAALVDGDIPGTHSGSAHHAEAHAPESHTGQGATAAELETLTDTSDADALHNHPSDLTPAEHTSIGDSSPHHAEGHTLLSHSTVPQISDVVTFTGAPDGVTISGGTFNLPSAPFGLLSITGEGGVDDVLTDILTNGGSTTLVPGTKIWLTNVSGDAITIDHDPSVIFLQHGADVILDGPGVHIICLQAITNGLWAEYDRSPLLLPVASTTVSGRVELATAGEINASTSTTLAMSPGEFSDSKYGVRLISFRLFSSGVSCTTGDGAFFFQIPPELNGMNLVYVHARNYTPGTTGTMDIQIRRSRESNPTAIVNADMLTNKITIDSGEYGSHNAATAPSINGSNDDVATDDFISGDVDAIHSGTAAKGCVVTLGFRIP
ncbi:hypothetical protein LCGC14_1598470, partial [marine sediment metagenome]